MQEQQTTHLITALKVSPSAATAGAVLWGFTLNEWAAITAITYSVLMTYFLLRDRFKKWQSSRKKKNGDKKSEL